MHVYDLCLCVSLLTCDGISLREINFIWFSNGNVVIKAQSYKQEGRGFDTRNEYQKHKNYNVSGE
jgi:hypothetical protein